MIAFLVWRLILKKRSFHSAMVIFCTFSLTVVSAIKDGQVGRQKWAGPGRSGCIRRSLSGIISTAGGEETALLEHKTIHNL